MFMFRNFGYYPQVILACGLLMSGASVATAQSANVAPVISGTPPASVAPGQSYSFRPVASDANGDRLRFSLSNRPRWLGFNSSTGQIYGIAPRSNAGRTYSNLVLSVSDGRIRVALPAFSITVSATVTNRAPTVSGAPATTVTAGSAYAFQPTGSDPDGQTLTWSIANKPSWATFSSSSGRLSGTPTSTSTGTTSNIVITASDGSLSASLAPFSISVVAAANRAPTVSGAPATTVTAGSAYAFQPTGSDPDGQTLTWSIANKPSWATFSSSSGRLSGTPTSTSTGTTSNIVITASDGSLSASLAPFSISVNAAANRAPSISGTPPTSVVAGSTYSFTPAASDPDGNSLGFSITGKPSWAAFATSTGQLTGTPTTAQAGTYSNIVITVSDGIATQALPAFTINVTQPQPSGTAALSWTAPTQNTDGSALTDLAGYRVYYGTSASALNQVVVVPGSASVSYTFSQLARGTHYFAVTAYNTAGTESAMSAVGSKTIP
jgi:hypothetical protein